MASADHGGVFRLTVCRKPCVYKMYKFIGEKIPTTFVSSHFVFALWAITNDTLVEVEELIYPLQSLVGDFGGTLGRGFGKKMYSL